MLCGSVSAFQRPSLCFLFIYLFHQCCLMEYYQWAIIPVVWLDIVPAPVGYCTLLNIITTVWDIVPADQLDILLTA